MKNLPLVSITITTKNEEKNIERCLKSIKKQTYPQHRIEIIVVDNNSLDKTKKIAKKYTKNVFNKGPERSNQRNFGMLKKSKGKYLMFLDADMVLSAKIVKEAVTRLENNSLVALYFPEIVLGNSFWSKVRNFERGFYDGTVIDCVRFFRKDVFVKVDGFYLPVAGSEDWDLDKKIRNVGSVEVLRKKGAFIIHNETEFNLKKYLLKKNYYCQTFAQYINKWRHDDSDIKKQFGFFYRYFQIFTENGKWKKLIKQPFLTLGMYFLRILVGAIYLYQSYSPKKKTTSNNYFYNSSLLKKNLKLPLVSIIIPTYYSSQNIKDCLKSIRQQTYKNIEIIIVDNFSQDKIKLVAKKYKAKIFFYGPDQKKKRVFGAPYQRNYGFKKAKGKYLYYVDADMILSKKLILECVAICEKNKEILALIIREISFGKGFWAKCKWLERETYWGDNSIESPRFFRRKVLDDFGGLDEKLGGGGDDMDLTLRLRAKKRKNWPGKKFY